MTKRQPRGIPVGGQFAESARGEADVAAPAQGSVAERADEILGGRITQLPYEVCDISEETAAANPAYQGMTFDEAVVARLSVASDLLERHGDEAFDVAARDQADARRRIVKLFGGIPLTDQDPNSPEEYAEYERQADLTDYEREMYRPEVLEEGWFIDIRDGRLGISWAGGEARERQVKNTAAGRDAARQFTAATDAMEAIEELQAIRAGAPVWSFLKPTEVQEGHLERADKRLRFDLWESADSREILRSSKAQAQAHEGMSDEEIAERVRSRFVRDGEVRGESYWGGDTEDLWYDKAARDAGDTDFETLTDSALRFRVEVRTEGVHDARRRIPRMTDDYDAKLLTAASEMAYYEQQIGYPGGGLSPQFSDGSWSDETPYGYQRRAVPTRAGFEDHEPPDLGAPDRIDTGMTIDELEQKHRRGFGHPGRSLLLERYDAG